MVMDVALFTTRPVPAVAPKSTTVAPVKLVPVTVTEVPPASGPELGATPVTVTGGRFALMRTPATVAVPAAA